MYQAKLQLRPKNTKLYFFVRKEIKENRTRIVKIAQLKEGTDIYIDSNTFAVRLGARFKKKFGGKTKITRSIYGFNREKTKRIHRLTVLLRMPEPEEEKEPKPESEEE